MLNTDFGKGSLRRGSGQLVYFTASAAHGQRGAKNKDGGTS